MPLTLHAAIRLLSDHDLLSKVVRGTGLAQDIPDDMMRHVTDPHVDAGIIVDRVEALTAAIGDARRHPERHDIVLVIGKGHERWIKDRNRHGPYEGDDAVGSRLLSEPLE